MGVNERYGGEKHKMPNAKVLSEKQAVVDALVERIKGSSAGVLVDYKGITVAEDTALRTEEDPIAPFRILNDYSKKLGDRFNIKAAYMEGKILDENEIAEMAALPSKSALYSKVLGTMIAPITGLAVCLGQILEQKGGSVGGDAAEEAPAEA